MLTDGWILRLWQTGKAVNKILRISIWRSSTGRKTDSGGNLLVVCFVTIMCSFPSTQMITAFNEPPPLVTIANSEWVYLQCERVFNARARARTHTHTHTHTFRFSYLCIAFFFFFFYAPQFCTFVDCTRCSEYFVTFSWQPCPRLAPQNKKKLWLWHSIRLIVIARVFHTVLLPYPTISTPERFYLATKSNRWHF